ncbi:MAG: hemolysin family protein [Marinifilaceae bacterium]
MSTWIVIIICLLLSAFFSGMEIAYLSSNRLRIEIDKSNKSLSQSLIDLFVRNSDMYLTTILVGNNATVVIFSMVFANWLQKYIQLWSVSVGLELFIQTVISTLIVLIFAEFLPKTIFRLRSNMFLKALAVPVFLFYLILFPISYFAVWFGKFLVRIFSGKQAEAHENNQYFNKVDLNNLIDQGEMPTLEKDEVHELKLFRNALDFSEIKVRECIVPRTDMIALPLDSTIETLTETFVKTGYSRILIYKDNIDDILGYVHSSSLFKNPKTVEEAMSNVIIVPEAMSVLKLLDNFIKEHKSISIVVDEFGVTAGMVTMEDIIEEIFGEIEDEHDHRHTHMKDLKISENKYILSGRLDVDFLNEKYGLKLDEKDEYETLAGYILYHNPDIPNEGEVIVIDVNEFRIIKVKNARIEEVELTQKIAEKEK